MPSRPSGAPLAARSAACATPAPSATQAVLREARRLHRAATSDATVAALPVLRRLLAAQALPQAPLPELFRQRAQVQRKHVLRMLAAEAGHASWEAYAQVLPTLDAGPLLQAFDSQRGSAMLKLWFSDEAQARAHAEQHGGQVLRVGRQAVVVPPDAAPGVPSDG